MASSDLTQRAQSKVGQTLRAKWRLDRLIGVGGMASVYSATHRNGKRGAVKILHPEMCLIEEAKSRFLREGYVANRVEHPGAVAVLDDDIGEDGSVFLVMELLEGKSLEATLMEWPGHRMPESRAVPIIVEMLDVIAAAHGHGVIHRDLKPDNVFVTSAGRVKVLDFGIARLRETAQTAGTQTGSLLGTPNFMPPEQALGDWQKVDGRTDLWAVGATLFAMLTGRAVHLGDSPQKVLLSAMTNPAPPLRSIAPEIDPYAAYVVDRALAFERDRRWSSAQEMKAALVAFVQAGFAAPAGWVAQVHAAHSGFAPAPHVAGGYPSAATAPSLAALARSSYPSQGNGTALVSAELPADRFPSQTRFSTPAPFGPGTLHRAVVANTSAPQARKSAAPWIVGGALVFAAAVAATALLWSRSDKAPGPTGDDPPASAARTAPAEDSAPSIPDARAALPPTAGGQAGEAQPPNADNPGAATAPPRADPPPVDPPPRADKPSTERPSTEEPPAVDKPSTAATADSAPPPRNPGRAPRIDPPKARPTSIFDKGRQ